MLLFALSLPLLPLSISALPTTTTVAAATACDDIHIFLARGTGEEYPGRQSSIVSAVCNGTDASCGYENIKYPATFNKPACKFD